MARKRADKSMPEHERIRRDRERRLRLLEKDLVAALNQPTVNLDMSKMRKKGLLAALRENKERGHRLLL